MIGPQLHDKTSAAAGHDKQTRADWTRLRTGRDEPAHEGIKVLAVDGDGAAVAVGRRHGAREPDKKHTLGEGKERKECAQDEGKGSGLAKSLPRKGGRPPARSKRER